jgi:hypothetical protein
MLQEMPLIAKERNAHNSHSRAVLPMKGSGKATYAMGSGFKTGRMEPGMKENGRTIKCVAKESSGITMETSTKGTG